jgi:SAM-dependent methyltransferase
MSRLRAAVYDRLLAGSEQAGLADWRRELVCGLAGKVLEVGAGTGLTLAHYPPAVTRLVCAEPDRHMRRRLERRITDEPAAVGHVSVIDAGAEYLPFPDRTFDAVVAVLVLCSVDDPEAAAAEVHRVLRPGGRFAFLEHVLDDRGGRAARRQALFEPVWKRLAGNCHLTRETATVIGDAGLALDAVATDPLPRAPVWARPAVRGVAVRPGEA